VELRLAPTPGSFTSPSGFHRAPHPSGCSSRRFRLPHSLAASATQMAVRRRDRRPSRPGSRRDCDRHVSDSGGIEGASGFSGSGEGATEEEQNPCLKGEIVLCRLSNCGIELYGINAVWKLGWVGEGGYRGVTQPVTLAAASRADRTSFVSPRGFCGRFQAFPLFSVRFRHSRPVYAGCTPFRRR